MGCILLILGLAFPRIAIVFLWFLTSWFRGMFQGWLIPILAFLLLPYSLLWYSVVHNVFHGQWGLWQMLIMAVAVVVDVSSYGAARRR